MPPTNAQAIRRRPATADGARTAWNRISSKHLIHSDESGANFSMNLLMKKCWIGSMFDPFGSPSSQTRPVYCCIGPPTSQGHAKPSAARISGHHWIAARYESIYFPTGCQRIGYCRWNSSIIVIRSVPQAAKGRLAEISSVRSLTGSGPVRALRGRYGRSSARHDPGPTLGNGRFGDT
jgi:hypothetical protein